MEGPGFLLAVLVYTPPADHLQKQLIGISIKGPTLQTSEAWHNHIRNP